MCEMANVEQFQFGENLMYL